MTATQELVCSSSFRLKEREFHRGISNAVGMFEIRQFVFTPVQNEIHSRCCCAFLLVALQLPGTLCTSSAATFASDTLIGITDSSFDGQDIIVSNCTLTVDGSHAFNSLQVLAGGKLTHSFSNGLSLVAWLLFG